ncbi:MAG TPA: hypothetical protein PKZ65_10265 [Methanoregulaceae archaeon]|nr:hypothetical protein [Methanoregulaceae archaeon]
MHDPVRKQSIHAVIDLFEKGALPIEEQDIKKARQLITGKCDILKKEHSYPGVDTEVLLQLRVCIDISIFLDDMEKIFRLIQRQGVTANYLMMLGAFSKVIEEHRNLHLPEMFDLEKEEIDSLARPLAGIIRLRLGNSPDLRWILRELSFIAARFNQLSPELKFDMDILQIVAPAVAGHFLPEVPAREVQAILPSYMEESELEEFESFLNRTPDHVKQEQEADINWDSIYEPLKGIAGIVAAQRDRWHQGNPDISSLYQPVMPQNLLYPGAGGYPAGYPAPQYPPQTSGMRTINVAVGPDHANIVEVRPEEPPAANPGPEPAKPGMPRWIPIVIGALLVTVVIFGTIVFSGYLNTTGGGSAVQPTGIPTLQPVTTMATETVPRTTTVPVTTRPAATATPVPTIKSYSPTDVGNHLLDIAFGPDYNLVKKPTKSPLAVSCMGTCDAGTMILLNGFIGQFNNLSSTMKLGENLEQNTPADVTLTLLPEKALSQVNVDKEGTVAIRDTWTGAYYFIHTSENRTYVNADLKGTERDRWVLRALLYNLGFYGESAKYPESIFYAGSNEVGQPSAVDWKAIQLMYGQKVKNGMTKANVKALI